MKDLRVLSLFDGMSCGQIALERAEVPVEAYYAAEIDKYAISVAQHNYPDTVQLGDVTAVSDLDVGAIDLLIGGSPCQGFSFAGKRLNFEDPRSKLFFEFVRLYEELKPKYFLLENVKMSKESQAVITDFLGVEPVPINSGLLSAQNRNRLYWTNIPFDTNIEDRGLVMADIWNGGKEITERVLKKVPGTRAFDNCFKFTRTLEDKARCLLTSPQGISNQGATNIHIVDKYYTLTPLECERLQTVPDNYTAIVSDAQRYKMLGNGWTVDIIAHIFSALKDCFNSDIEDIL